MDETANSSQTRYISLLQGEDILLREDSAVVMGTNSSEAHGVLFVTNYQLLFCGSFVQLPDENSWHGPSPIDAASDLSNKPDASPVVARPRQPKQKLRPRASVIEPSMMKGLRQTIQRSRSTESSISREEKRSRTLPIAQGSPTMMRFRASFSTSALKRPHSDALLCETTQEGTGHTVKSGNSRFYTSETTAGNAEVFEVDQMENANSSDCVNGNVSFSDSPLPLTVEKASASTQISIVKSPATPETVQKWQSVEDASDSEDDKSQSDSQHSTATSTPGQVPSPKPQPNVQVENNASSSTKKTFKELHHGNSSFFIGSAQQVPTTIGETSESSGAEEEREESVATLPEQQSFVSDRAWKRSGSRFFTDLPADSVISTEISPKFKMKISMPLCRICRIKQLAGAKAAQGRLTAKIPAECLELSLKTGQVYKLAMLSTRALDAVLGFSRDLQLRQAASPNHFAQVHAQAVLNDSTNLKPSSERKINGYEWEARRLEITEDSVWQFVNTSLMTPSYPEQVIVPLCTPHVDLVRLAAFHRFSRFPVVSWMDISTGAVLLRSSTFVNHLGDHTHRSPIHEGLMHAICTLNTSAAVSEERLHVFFERRKGSSHVGSLSMEQRMSFYYPGCKFCYCEEFSIHTVRKSFKSLRTFLHKQVDPSKYFSSLEETGWLHQVSTILSFAVDIVSAMKTSCASVLVALEDGWDATAQVVSLAQVLLDPYYRTIQGFQRLIKKDWHCFSHPFADRHYSRGEKQYPKTEAPIFLQWLDCVWQVWTQFPSAFEFSSSFLEFLAREAYNGRFGTFLTNGSLTSSSAYATEEISKHTLGLWAWLKDDANKNKFLNSWYLPNSTDGELRPGCSVSSLQLWNDFYLWPFIQAQLVDAHVKAAERLDQLVQRYQALQKQLASLSDGPTDQVKSVSIKKYAHLWCKRAANAVEADSVDVTGGSLPEVRKDVAVAAGDMAGVGVIKRSAAGAAVDSSVSAKGAAVPLRHNDNTLQRPVSMLVYVSSTGTHGTTNLLTVLKEKGLSPGGENEVRVDKLSCCGNLDKMGGLHRAWKKRWFHLDLTKQYLAYFVNKEASSVGKQPKGVILLHDIGKIYQQEKKEMLLNHIFTVELQQRTWLLQAPSRDTMFVWMACLEQARSP